MPKLKVYPLQGRRKRSRGKSTLTGKVWNGRILLNTGKVAEILDNRPKRKVRRKRRKDLRAEIIQAIAQL